MTIETQTTSDPRGMLSHRWAVILAGGDGQRLLSLTRKLSGDDRPKQFCGVLGEKTLLDQTLDRVARVVSPDRTFSVVTKTPESFYSRHKSAERGGGLLVQPCNRGTSPAIVYSLVRLQKLDSRSVVGFFPSDHHFANEEGFSDCVLQGFESAELHTNAVILLGVAPNQPESGYGWIEPGEPLPGSAPGLVFGVRRFWEKPSIPVAIDLMRRGCFWNSFIMVGRVGSFLSLIRLAAPHLLRSVRLIAPTLFTKDEEASVRDLYMSLPSSSFSTDVLSICPGKLAVLCSRTLEWADVGDVSRALSLMGANAPVYGNGISARAAERSEEVSAGRLDERR